MQEPLKRRLHRWARLIRRQPGLEGLKNQRETENRNQQEWDFSHPFIFKHPLSKDPPTGRGSSSGDLPTLDRCSSSCLFLYGNVYLRGLFGCLFWLRLIRISTCLEAIKWITDSLSTVLCGHRSLLFTPHFYCVSHQNPWQGSVEVCVFCVCERVKCLR